MNKNEFLEFFEQGKYLHEENQVEIFQLPPKDAFEVFLGCINLQELCPKAQLAIYNLPAKHAAKFLRRYVHDYTLCDEALVKVFTLPQTPAIDIIAECIDLHHVLPPEAQLGLLSFPSEIAVDFLMQYIQYESLCDEAQVKIFDLPPRRVKEFMYRFTCFHSLCRKAERKMFELPTSIAGEVVLDYVSYHSLFNENEVRIFNFPPRVAKRILLRYKNRLCRSAERKMFAMYRPKDILCRYVEKFALGNNEKKIFDLPFDTAKEVFLKYIAARSLALKAQLKIFELPKKKAKEFSQEYQRRWQFLPQAEAKGKELGIL